MAFRDVPLLSSRAGVACATGLLVFASRAWLIQVWGAPLPNLDEWDVESALYRAWLDGTLRWNDLFAAHNEHRIALTRLADLALFGWHGGWNVWGQLALNAALHAVTAASLVAVFWDALAARLRLGLVVGIAVLFTAPSGWQNALWGFQSQVGFANVLTVGACAGLVLATPLGPRWWLGWAAAAVALFSNAGGALAVPAVLVALGAALAFGTTGVTLRRSVSTLVLLAAILAVAFALRVAPAGHQPLQAQTTRQFFATLAHTASWPHVDSAWPWIVMQLPLVALCTVRWRRREPLDAVDRCALALGCVALLQAAAIAYTRGGALPGFRPLSRYQDPLLLGVVAQLFCGLRLAQLQGKSGRLFLLGWIAVAAFGLLRLTETNLTLNLPYKRARDQENAASVRAFLHAAPAARTSLEPTLSGLHPDPSVVRRVLEDPRLQPVLPGELRVSVDSALATPTRPWVLRHGFELTLAAAAWLCAALAVSQRRVTSDAPADNPGARRA